MLKSIITCGRQNRQAKTIHCIFLIKCPGLSLTFWTLLPGGGGGGDMGEGDSHMKQTGIVVSLKDV